MPADRRTAILMAVFAGAVFLLLQAGQILGSDGHSVYEMTKSMVTHHSLAVGPNDNATQGLGGHYFSKYGVGLSLVAVIPYVLFWPIAHLGGNGDAIEQFGVASLMPVIGALLVGFLYVAARRAGAARRASIVTAVGAVIGTFLLAYTMKEFFGEPLIVLCTVICAERLLARKPTQAALALAFAAVVRPQVLAVVPVFVLVLYMEGGWQWVRRCLAPFAAAVAIIAAYNAARFGSVTDTGYRNEGFTTPFFKGANGLLFNPAKSILLFAPAVVLAVAALPALWRRHRSLTMFLAGNALITFVLTATWWSWEGGWSWGPRLLLPAIVPLFVALGPWISSSHVRERALLATFAVGFVVSASTLLVPTQAQLLDRPVPKTGPSITRQYGLVPDKIRYTAQHVLDTGDADHRYFVDLWQAGLVREVGKKGIVLAGAGSAALIALLVGVVLYRRRIEDAVRLGPVAVAAAPKAAELPLSEHVEAAPG